MTRSKISHQKFTITNKKQCKKIDQVNNLTEMTYLDSLFLWNSSPGWSKHWQWCHCPWILDRFDVWSSQKAPWSRIQWFCSVKILAGVLLVREELWAMESERVGTNMQKDAFRREKWTFFKIWNLNSLSKCAQSMHARIRKIVGALALTTIFLN